MKKFMNLQKKYRSVADETEKILLELIINEKLPYDKNFDNKISIEKQIVCVITINELKTIKRMSLIILPREEQNTQTTKNQNINKTRKSKIQ